MNRRDMLSKAEAKVKHMSVVGIWPWILYDSWIAMDRIDT